MARNSQQLDGLKKQIEQFLQFDKEKLIARPEWGTITLEDVRSDIDRIYSIINYLKVLPVELLTINAISSITNEIQQVNGLFDTINKFSIESGSPAQQRDQFISQIQNRADSLYAAASPWIPFLAYQKGDVARNVESLTASVKEAEILVKEAKTNIDQKGKEIDDIIIKAREASASAGAAVFTQDFKKEASELKETAQIWLKVTAFLGVITVFAAAFLWYFTEAGLDQGQIWQKITTKIVVLGILVTATIWCGKIYRALMHQSAIYQHRALSIQTLQAFSSAAKDVQIKDAVVLEAAKAVFSSTSTGYIDSSKDGSEGNIKILEIAKNVLPKSNT
ncbi:MAG: hypothetical protein ACOYVJ_02925 [Nitrospirota bacterium]